jgi:hypothetical protein
MTDAPRKICTFCWEAFCEAGEHQCSDCRAARDGYATHKPTKPKRPPPPT